MNKPTKELPIRSTTINNAINLANPTIERIYEIILIIFINK